ncbi:LysR family transcriptional regulator [Halomonas campisalis]|uniref:LysR family transcriptional regulator n=1 Tax=Billgrantia campisalis TaxID=74661 RepID=A0ABS9P5C9_9GAMM|nr:LysR family transcriptional regulator [Halomonas campisalis]MCG6656983.1 LysR family transcriptional regulator [Halomonas campisalis]MDR5862170.1 LysR family transcriptional regulator [Halomonas campisalis]
MKLNFRSIDLNLLPVFAAVVEEGQLARAAERLGMSQPAVSAALKRLRLTVGAPLFSRSRAGLSPTPLAQELYQRISQGLSVLAEALDPEQVFDPTRSDRDFRLVAGDYFDTLLLGRLIASLRRQQAPVTVQALPLRGEWLTALLHADVDIVLDTVAIDDHRVNYVVISEDSPVVVARQDHPCIRDRITLDDFFMAEHVVLPPRERGVLPLDQILADERWPRRQRRIGVQVSQFTNQFAVVAESDLIATVPRRLAKHLAPSLGLQVMEFPISVPRVPIYLLWPKVLDHDPGHQWFREQLTEQVRLLD